MTVEIWVTAGLGVATIAAIIIGPIWALHIQRKIEKERDERSRRFWVFKTLMSFRATNLSPHFVQALNLIDVEFDSPKEKPVRIAWKVLLDHFTEWGSKPADRPLAEAKADQNRAQELTAKLLVTMGASLGYSFDEIEIKKGAYYPQGLGSVEDEQNSPRRGILNLLAGHSKLPIAVFEQKFAPLTDAEDATAARGIAAGNDGKN